MEKYIEIRAENQRRIIITQYEIDIETPTQEQIFRKITEAVTDFYLRQKTYTRILQIKVHLSKSNEYIAFEKKYKR